ncbi:HTH domain protein [Natronomonas pharaonis DSM 2160]|uniref:HTH domain protein n=1 Tax=Natronomonas pharaonis (strain ATCC 35678 / DSM 2160 / CIP 103997 / JCM 8858 / NBRC 14720 / NCIMB 2260 / Gabara) TaxID=348780 RepID=A0A1U7EWY6_NATPD|nr:hypothetical protein [Natronomonas pharaonis]CAI49625.1 HTH domain protein [Natronomonas pharaonis DSM 2160]
MIDRLARQLRKEERDLLVLEIILQQHPIGIERIAEEAGLDEHKTRHSMRMLEDDDLIEPTPQGAVPTDGVEERIGRIHGGIDSLIDRMEELKQYGNQ